ncbi:MAG: hypothetical protein OEY22_09930 [Candidatus Bathyarchaeota archaeon]|nr:hypothetical protein [Candidatus Bathyarchaeota archaeon]MDH5787117.1 hypothetical protein [Candidatus Bathyarchaeota archaeon]
MNFGTYDPIDLRYPNAMVLPKKPREARRPKVSASGPGGLEPKWVQV